MFSISVETRAGMTRHHLDRAVDAFSIVEHMQKETHLPIVITNRATGHVLTVEELRRLANLERSRAHRSSKLNDVGRTRLGAREKGNYLHPA